jgi:hypothetical protein
VLADQETRPGAPYRLESIDDQREHDRRAPSPHRGNPPRKRMLDCGLCCEQPMGQLDERRARRLIDIGLRLVSELEAASLIRTRCLPRSLPTGWSRRGRGSVRWESSTLSATDLTDSSPPAWMTQPSGRSVSGLRVVESWEC